MSGLYHTSPAANFNEALPLGNGRIGAMAYGGVKQIRLSLNEDTLWSGYPRTSAQTGRGQDFLRARALVLEGRLQEAQELLEENFGDFLVQMYLPLADLTLEMDHGEQADGYERRLDLQTAVHTVRYRQGDRAYTRRCFISAPHQTLALHIACSRPGSVGFRLRLKGRLQCREGGVSVEGNCPVCLAPFGETHNEDDKKFYFPEEERKGVGYRAAVKVCCGNGEITQDESGLTVRGADEATVYLAVRTSFNGFDKHPALEGRPYREACGQDLERAARLGFPELLRAHIADYGALFGRACLTLDGESHDELPTPQRMARLAQGGADAGLYTLLFDFGRYLTIACSREGAQPANLQGIWNEKLIPPWSCNLTLNINLEMNYWPALACGLTECYRPLLAMVKELSVTGQRAARDYFGAPGWCVAGSSTDLWRAAHPTNNRLPGNTQWGFWQMAGGWLCRMLYDYYDYTRDEGTLREILPVLEGCSRFYESLLMEKDGELIFCPSTSPENNYLHENGYSPLDLTTTMTMAIIRDSLTVTAKAREMLGLDASGLRDTAARLRGYHVNADGSLNEWYGEHEDWDAHHRHMSHLYGLFPSNQIRKEPLLDACRKTLLKRGDDSTGWSLAWKVNLWARLGDGEHALRLLNRQLRLVKSGREDMESGGGTYPNFLCAHPPFQIDGSFGVCSGIVQMLLQADGDEVTLLPALPASWKSGSARGLRLPGGGILDFAWKDGKVVHHQISGKKTDYRVVFR